MSNTMKKTFDIAKRNEDARRELVVLENEIKYAEQRKVSLGRSWRDAEKAGDRERAERLYQSWKQERDDYEAMVFRREELKVLMAEKKYANQHLYTDINPYEVIEELSDKRILVRAMKSTLKPEAREALQASFSPGGFFGHTDNDAQDWDITPDENGVVVEIRRHKDGLWYEVGSRHCPFRLETKPVKFYDYNF